MTASPTSIMVQFEQDEKVFAVDESSVDLQPEGGTPLGKFFQCCFPKEKKCTALPEQVGRSVGFKEPEVDSRGRATRDASAVLRRDDQYW
jgi:hypothetical protein